MHMHMNSNRWLVAGAVVFVGGALIWSSVSGASTGPTTPRPPPPDMRVAHQYPVLGANGQPVLAPDGEPYTMTVGGSVPRPRLPKSRHHKRVDQHRYAKEPPLVVQERKRQSGQAAPWDGGQQAP